jgi:Transposase
MGRGAGQAATKWRELIRRWRRSSLSVAEFCRRQEIAQASFYQWRKRLESEEPGAESLRFVQLPTPAWTAAKAIEMRLPGGAVVSFSDRAAPELVAAAIRAAMQAPAEEPRPC